jgi:hypothetical protein
VHLNQIRLHRAIEDQCVPQLPRRITGRIAVLNLEISGARLEGPGAGPAWLSAAGAIVLILLGICNSLPRSYLLLDIIQYPCLVVDRRAVLQVEVEMPRDEEFGIVSWSPTSVSRGRDITFAPAPKIPGAWHRHLMGMPQIAASIARRCNVCRQFIRADRVIGVTSRDMSLPFQPLPEQGTSSAMMRQETAPLHFSERSAA